MLLIRNTLNWSIRVILAVIFLWGILPYMPKTYEDNDKPNKNFPILIVNSENKPDILKSEDWVKASTKPTFWIVSGDGKALMGSMTFAYSVALSPSKKNSPSGNKVDNVVVTLKRDDPDHIVSATYNISNNNFSPVKYHSIDPGIAFVFILLLFAWGISVLIRRIIFAILDRFAKRNHYTTDHNCSSN
ncbi:membrane protein [Candidatus Magnetoovum chiemensis]|nr:membrane protein [Candidatus Magnetoovum chiemensis]